MRWTRSRRKARPRRRPGMADRPKNYTTVIAAKRTAQECVSLLAEAGADHVAVSYENRQPTGLGFSLDTPHGSRSFLLPVNIDGVHKMLRAADFASLHPSQARLLALRSREHAADVAWRGVRDLAHAPLAPIAPGEGANDQGKLPQPPPSGGGNPGGGDPGEEEKPSEGG